MSHRLFIYALQPSRPCCNGPLLADFDFNWNEEMTRAIASFCLTRVIIPGLLLLLLVRFLIKRTRKK